MSLVTKKGGVVSVALFLVSATAFAMPSVGDDAVFDITVTANGQSATGSAEFQLVSFDASSNQYDEKTSITIGSQTSTQDSQVSSANLLTDAQIASVLQNCAQLGGKNDNVTVPAGSFEACALPSSSDQQTGTAWIGNVSFGIVKQDMVGADGTHTILELHTQHLD